jgi:RNA polymerase sigma-70 factor (ECF subfamily)
VLLRPDLHVRSHLRLPAVLRVRRSPREVSGMADAAARVIEALAPSRGKFLDFARARVGADADEVVQLALLRAALKADSLRDVESAVPWFFQILRRTIADHHGQRARAPEAPLDDEPTTESEPSSDACACSLGVLERLRPEYVEMLRRVDLDEESIASVAASLGITANNATVRLHRARKALREALVAYCGTDSMRACMSCGCDG